MHRDIVEIEQLLYRCCHAVDRGELDEIVGLFHPSATMLIKWEENGIYRGREAIRGWFEDYKALVIESLKFLHHKIASPSIEIEGDRAISHSYLTVDSVAKDTEQIMVTIGHYDDKYVKIDDRWYFDEKAIFIDYAYLSHG